MKNFDCLTFVLAVEAIFQLFADSVEDVDTHVGVGSSDFVLNVASVHVAEWSQGLILEFSPHFCSLRCESKLEQKLEEFSCQNEQKGFSISSSGPSKSVEIL